MSIWEATIDDRSARPFSRIAQAVSSQEVSIARIRADFRSFILVAQSHALRLHSTQREGLILASTSSSAIRNHTGIPRGSLSCHRGGPSTYLRSEIPFPFPGSINPAQ